MFEIIAKTDHMHKIEMRQNGYEYVTPVCYYKTVKNGNRFNLYIHILECHCTSHNPNKH